MSDQKGNPSGLKKKNSRTNGSVQKVSRKRKLRKDRLAAAGAVLLVLFVGAGYLISRLMPSGSQKQVVKTTIADTDQTQSSDTDRRNDSVVHVTATGDILLEEPILEWMGEDGWKNYMDLLQPYFQNDDLTIANQEVPIGGEELGITGIDFSFNSPAYTASELKRSGIDFVTLANNHALDRGEAGIANTHQNLDSQEIGYTGTYLSEEDRDSVRVININGIRIGIVSYTYNTNQPLENNFDTNVFYSADSEAVSQLTEDVRKAKESADVVIAAMHWGTEFTYELNWDQTALSSLLANLGVDVIIGNHPHTIQPAEWITAEDGHQTLCFYSLGNLVSSAYTVSRADETFQNMYEVGALAEFDLVKNEDGSVGVENPQLIPVVNHFQDEYQDFQLIPLKDYTEEQASVHDQRRFSDLFTADWLKGQVSSVFEGSGIPVLLDQQDS